jgi:hypothetical protein
MTRTSEPRVAAARTTMHDNGAVRSICLPRPRDDEVTAGWHIRSAERGPAVSECNRCVYPDGL